MNFKGSSEWKKEHVTDILLTRYCKILVEKCMTAIIFAMGFAIVPCLIANVILSRIGIDVEVYTFIAYVLLTILFWRLLIKHDTCKTMFKYELTQDTVEDFIGETIDKGW